MSAHGLGVAEDSFGGEFEQCRAVAAGTDWQRLCEHRLEPQSQPERVERTEHLDQLHFQTCTNKKMNSYKHSRNISSCLS